MFKKIMVPVDLAHLDALEKSLTVAADLARHYKTALCYVSVTSSQPGVVSKNAGRVRAEAQGVCPQPCAGHRSRSGYAGLQQSRSHRRHG